MERNTDVAGWCSVPGFLVAVGYGTGISKEEFRVDILADYEIHDQSESVPLCNDATIFSSTVDFFIFTPKAHSYRTNSGPIKPHHFQCRLSQFWILVNFFNHSRKRLQFQFVR